MYLQWTFRQGRGESDRYWPRRPLVAAVAWLLLGVCPAAADHEANSTQPVGQSAAAGAKAAERAESLLRQEQTRAALETVETFKARVFDELLLSEGIAVPLRDTVAQRLGGTLSSWPSDTVCLEYVLGNEHAWVIVIDRRGQLQAHRLTNRGGGPVTSRRLAERVRDWLDQTDRYSQKMLKRVALNKGMDHSWQHKLHELYEILIPLEVRSQLEQADCVLIVPQHILRYFPFRALVVQTDESVQPWRVAEPRFLLDEPFHVFAAPSIIGWQLLRDRHPTPTPLERVTAFGLVDVEGFPRLPGVKRELDAAASIFGARMRRVRAHQTSETGVRRLLEQPGLILFATHGSEQPQQPLDSFLLVAAPSEPSSAGGEASPVRNDGRLTARELLQSPVEAPVVVLSACYSGIGQQHPRSGDGLLGLERAFLHSGASTVVSGMWDIYDGVSPSLMRRFLQRIDRGKSIAAALSGAQRSLLDELRSSQGMEPWLHPYFWAVYRVWGDGHLRFPPTGTRPNDES